MLSINAKLLSRDASMLAQAALVTSALAVEDYRAKQKSLPKTLDQALAPVPSDPFDGQPIRYRPTQNGYVLYSIDSDANDDGGREIPQEKKHSDRSTYDLTFIVEREK